MFKKIFVVCIAFFGMYLVFKGFVSAFEIQFNSLNNNFTYNFGYNCGLLLGKLMKICFGFFVVWQTYKWFCDEEKNSSDLINF